MDWMNTSLSPRSGQLKVAQRFIAGSPRSSRQTVRRVDGWNLDDPDSVAHSTGSQQQIGAGSPALKCRAINKCPPRGLTAAITKGT